MVLRVETSRRPRARLFTFRLSDCGPESGRTGRAVPCVRVGQLDSRTPDPPLIRLRTPPPPRPGPSDPPGGKQTRLRFVLPRVGTPRGRDSDEEEYPN